MTCLDRRVAYQKWTTAIPITTLGNIFSVTLTEFARISLPSYPHPIKLVAKTVFQNTTGVSSTNGDAYMVMAPAGAVGAAVAAALGVDSHGEINIGGSTIEPPGRRMSTSFWLPADSGGDWIVGGWRDDNGAGADSDAVSSIANSLIPGEFWAER